jgi:hypothetical protein
MSHKEISLSDDLKYWRAERPDEWTFDIFIKKALILEQQLLEANARVARLESVIRVTVTDMTKQSGNFNMYGRLEDALVETPAQSLAMHDADVIKHYLTGQLKSRHLNESLRNSSVKEGE